MIHIYKDRGYRNNPGKTLCGLSGSIYNHNKRHEYFTCKEDCKIIGVTSHKGVTCVTCLKIYKTKREEVIREINVKIKEIESGET